MRTKYKVHGAARFTSEDVEAPPEVEPYDLKRGIGLRSPGSWLRSLGQPRQNPDITEAERW